MVLSASKAMSWFSLSDLGLNRPQTKQQHPLPTSHLARVLCFEIAKTMSRLISLYKSLSHNEMDNLKNHIIKAEGVAYLNSKDESYLMSLALAEKLEELDAAADVISRLGRKCCDFGLMRFDLVYADLKLGSIDVGKLDYGSRQVEKVVQKLERYVSTTSMLYTATDSLTELETSDKKLIRWKRNNVIGSKPFDKTNFDLFDQKIAFQRKQVQHFRDVSLWSQTLDKSVAPMAQITCIIYARMCKVFAPYVSHHLLPAFFFSQKPSASSRISKSGPILKTSKKSVIQKFHSGELNTAKPEELIVSEIDSNISLQTPNKNRVFQGAPPTTVGGAGLALRYANLIQSAENCLEDPASVSSHAREELYQMLPEKLRSMVGSKMRKCWQRHQGETAEEEEEDLMLAQGWREGLRGILDWIAPMAQDTIEWQMQRNWEKKQGFEAKRRVLLIQTLHYADMEKTEAAIVELLVGLSCVYKYENRHYSPH
uniref:Avr9/Cf-9 rapidly elicited protein 137 n=1 Tax=Kalanchoe fedtschenkoi TaxID=63787 RepID=A0A7N0TV86_KALFE